MRECLLGRYQVGYEGSNFGCFYGAYEGDGLYWYVHDVKCIYVRNWRS